MKESNTSRLHLCDWTFCTQNVTTDCPVLKEIPIERRSATEIFQQHISCRKPGSNLIFGSIGCVDYDNLHTKFLTGCGPMLEKSLGIGDIRSSLGFCTPASKRPFLHMLQNFSVRRLAEFVVVNSSPLLLTSGAASETNSAMSFFTLHLLFFFPTLVLGGSRITMSNCSPLLASLVSQSKPFQ